MNVYKRVKLWSYDEGVGVRSC